MDITTIMHDLGFIIYYSVLQEEKLEETGI